ncbi:MAG: RagB/SusD family nutrient uptake outer membrane protein [Mucilaginibacter sp.]|uniref:RagB/SusD family nutrient uptake outer membrane protein n=1 Tax=Mucilaginibacter sp. TaxID=1882438 RepID=UPI0031ABCA17
MKTKYIFLKPLAIGAISILLLNQGCKKAVEVGKSKAVVFSEDVYSSNNGAQSVVAGIFTSISGGAPLYNSASDVSLTMGLASDELTNISSSTVYAPFYLNNYTPLVPPPFWVEIYKEVMLCNTAIEGINASSKITASVKKQLIGELKFLRGFAYFYAVNLYGTPPLILTTDYKISNTASGSTSSAIYAQIVQDFTDAQNSLADGIYVDASGTTVTDRIRPNKQAASAMLARVYLYMQDWKNAEAQASAVISSGNYTLVSNLNQAFLKASRETIWALQPVSTVNTNTYDGPALVVTALYKSSAQFAITSTLQSAFEPGDNRATNWVGTFTTASAPVTTFYYANKYKSNLLNNPVVTEYPVVLRLAEQYLIRAEARANQNNISGAVSDLNAIRARARQTPTSLPDYASTINKDDCLSDVMHERQVELFSEWGHRWFDLKRTGKLDAVMNVTAPVKGTTWSSYKQLMPIPSNDIIANPNLKQTPGYN